MESEQETAPNSRRFVVLQCAHASALSIRCVRTELYFLVIFNTRCHLLFFIEHERIALFLSFRCSAGRLPLYSHRRGSCSPSVLNDHLIGPGKVAFVFHVAYRLLQKVRNLKTAQEFIEEEAPISIPSREVYCDGGTLSIAVSVGRF